MPHFTRRGGGGGGGESRLQFEDFVSVLNSLYSQDVQRIYRLLERSAIFRPHFVEGGPDRREEGDAGGVITSDDREDSVDMVFGGGGNGGDNPMEDGGGGFPPFVGGHGGGGGGGEDEDPAAAAAARIQSLRAASCIRILGKGVIRVVHRVDDARITNNLDLSQCQLMQVPDAVYYLMRNTPLVECNLSSNVITKIPPKLPAKFSFIKRLDLSHNRLSTLPDEVTSLTQLERVDVSHNSFVALPRCIFTATKIADINASANFITDVDVHLIRSSPKLKRLNLEENPLTRQCEQQLSNLPGVEVVITQRGLQEWEDLEI